MNDRAERFTDGAHGASARGIVTKQPTGDVEAVELRNWASPPRSAENSASFHNRKLQRSLYELRQLDEIHVRQTVETIGSSCTGNNSYHIVNENGDVLFHAVEETTCCSRCWCGPARSFRMSLRRAGNEGEEILQIVRPHRCDASCCPCCLMKTMVQTPGGYVFGYTKQKWSLCGAVFSVLNRSDRHLAELQSSCCPCRCLTSTKISILSRNGEDGFIAKRWGGRVHNANMDHEFFVLKFPPGSDLQMKGILLGSAFLIDYMFFEMT